MSKNQLFLALSLLFCSLSALAELKELDEKQLEDLTGKEGITIDMSFKWEIGELYFDLNGKQQRKTPNIQAPVQPRPVSVIEYDLPD